MSNSKLLSIESNNNLNPVFNEDIKEYSINTSNQDFEIKCVSQEENASIELSINNNSFNAVGELEANSKLLPGENKVVIKVTSEDKSNVSEYKINIQANEYTYISDLNWEASSTVGYGEFKRDKTQMEE
ncbi:cadherin-like beta sandwich domain-containing protein [Clostridium septicum]|uniref:cadherin-like beta sandwich domain-containing protein n=1 Tax=Clostridium septicum TaxID=1504 RepID=UPI0013E8DEC9|nr:cadherin-like beta sandwich domain-containing protein [Clostridium septicum]